MKTHAMIGPLCVALELQEEPPALLQGLLRDPAPGDREPDVRGTISLVSCPPFDDGYSQEDAFYYVTHPTQRMGMDPEARAFRLDIRQPFEAMTRYWLNRDLFCMLGCISSSPILHSATVIHDGRAFVFCGPSGQGKSTMAKLMAETCMVVDDDSNWFVWDDNHVPCVVNVPYWFQESDMPLVPIQGIYFLEKAESCSLDKPLSQFDAIVKLLAHHNAFGTLDPTLKARTQPLVRLIDEIGVTPFRFNLDIKEAQRILFGTDDLPRRSRVEGDHVRVVARNMEGEKHGSPDKSF